MKRYTLTIEGMGCEHCVQKVRSAMEEIGAQIVTVRIGTAAVCFDGDPAALKEAVEDRGFDVISVEEE